MMPKPSQAEPNHAEQTKLMMGQTTKPRQQVTMTSRMCKRTHQRGYQDGKVFPEYHCNAQQTQGLPQDHVDVDPTFILVQR